MAPRKPTGGQPGQMDLFGVLVAPAVPPMLVPVTTVEDPTAAVSSVAPVASPPAGKGLGERYLYAALERWEALIYLWAGGTATVCAPRCDSYEDRATWRPGWVALDQAEAALTAAGWTYNHDHVGPFPIPGGDTRRARVWRRPSMPPPAAALRDAADALEVTP